MSQSYLWDSLGHDIAQRAKMAAHGPGQMQVQLQEWPGHLRMVLELLQQGSAVQGDVIFALPWRHSTPSFV